MPETNITGPLWGYEQRSRRLGGLWPTIAVPYYSISTAASSIDEGSSLTINVSGLNIPNGTYYWTINTNAGDFSTSSGSFTITSNAGSFTVTPTADTTLEGAETFTVSIRSGSTSGTVLSTSGSLTINDTSTAPVAGSAFGGGYYVGKMSINGNGVATHHLVVSDAAYTQTSLSWDNTVTGSSGTATGINNPINGPSNTTSLANNSKHEAAQYCENLNIGGYTDWYLPAIQELQMCYYYLKPTTALNHTYGASYGGPNPYAVSPQPINTDYTSSNPVQTTSTAFRTGGSQAFNANQTYYSSSEGTGLDVYQRLTVQTVYFTDGSQSNTNKSQSWAGVWTRAVRRVAI